MLLLSFCAAIAEPLSVSASKITAVAVAVPAIEALTPPATFDVVYNIVQNDNFVSLDVNS